jgi:thiamine-monophosphate kinase
VPSTTHGSSQDAPAALHGERGLIDRIRRRFPQPAVPLVVGIGDDAAVVQPDRGALQVLTTDALVEGVHFDRRYSSLVDIGYRALAVNLSDIAAMGAMPRHALLSLMLPEGIGVEEVEALADGVAMSAREARVGIAGGNITRTTGPLVVDMTVVGSVKPRKFLTRGGGRPGDVLYVSGTLGAAAAGLDWLRTRPAGPAGVPEEPGLATCVDRYRRPVPRLRLGALLGRTRAARACMDLSDGLADGVRQIAEASGTGVRVDADRLPIDPAARQWFSQRGADPVVSSIASGDDYELLFAVQPKGGGRIKAVGQLARGLALTAIGELTQESELVLVRNGQPEILPSGFSHF